MKRSFLFLVCLASLALSGMQAQTWHNPQSDGGCHVFGQGWPRSMAGKYQRLPTDMRSQLGNLFLWNNSLFTSGLYMRFRTDARDISVRYTLTKSPSQYAFVSCFGQAGVDLYARSDDGRTYHWLAPHVGNASFGTPAVANYNNIVPTNMEGQTVCEYLLYLPSLNGVSSLEVGVNADAGAFEWIETPEEDEPIVAYGSATVQGASASHPGNTWVNIVGRTLDTQMLNFGFLGLAKMEQGVFNVMAELKAKTFIIDAIPDLIGNPTVITERVEAGVRILRAASQCPILLVESPGLPDRLIRPDEDALHTAANACLRQAYDELHAAGCCNIFYMTQEELGLTADDFTDGIDVNDLGMKHYAEAYLKKLAYIEEHKEVVPDGVESLTPNPSPIENGAVYDLGGRCVPSEAKWSKDIRIVGGKKRLVDRK